MSRIIAIANHKGGVERKYYHITDPKNIQSIRENGLKANEEGNIFLFENKSIGYPTKEGKTAIVYLADHIAQNQIFLKKYAMFEISSKGIEGELVNDNVAEIGSNLQWIAKQPIILPEYIRPFGIFTVKKPKIV